jgi:hypothetical protein
LAHNPETHLENFKHHQKVQMTHFIFLFQFVSTTSNVQKRSINKKRRAIKQKIPLYEAGIVSCNYGPQDYDCDNYDYYVDDVDVSIHAKIVDQVDESEKIDPRDANAEIKAAVKVATTIEE